MKKEIKKDPPKTIKDQKVKDKMAATMAAAQSGKKIDAGNKTPDEGTVKPAEASKPVQQQTTPQQPAGHAKGCRCRDCVKADIHPADCLCTVCKQNRKKNKVKEPEQGQAVTQQPTQMTNSLPTGKVITEALNGLAVKPLAGKMGKNYEESKFTPDQIEVINECYPDGQLPRNWITGLTMTLLIGAGNIMQAGKAEIDKDEPDC